MDFVTGSTGVNTRRYTDDEMNGWWDVTRSGTWHGSDGSGKTAKVEMTQEKLEQMAADYSTELHYAPVTIDHLDEGTALGYVEQVRVMGDKLQAKVSWSDWGFYAVQDRAYVNRSIEMYDPLEHTGRAYLAGFTFLGAGKPAAKGLSPNPALLQDGRTVMKVSDDAMQLREEPEMDEKTLKEKIIGWFKAGEFATTTENEDDPVKLEEAQNEVKALGEKLTAAEDENKKLSEQVDTLTAELAEVKEAGEKKEREAALSEITGKIVALGESGQMVPVEVDAEKAMAENIPTDKLGEWWEQRQKVYEARGLNILAEKTKPEQKLPGKASRTGNIRALAESEKNPDVKRESLAAADLMDTDEKLEFSEAIKRVRAGK